jgi:hypothetical protein
MKKESQRYFKVSITTSTVPSEKYWQIKFNNTKKNHKW